MLKCSILRWNGLSMLLGFQWLSNVYWLVISVKFNNFHNRILTKVNFEVIKMNAVSDFCYIIIMYNNYNDTNTNTTNVNNSNNKNLLSVEIKH